MGRCPSENTVSQKRHIFCLCVQGKLLRNCFDPDRQGIGLSHKSAVAGRRGISQGGKKRRVRFCVRECASLHACLENGGGGRGGEGEEKIFPVGVERLE